MWKFCFNVLLFSLLLQQAGICQTNLNDVHVTPLEAAPITANAVTSMAAMSASALHIIKTDVQLVLVPVSVTDSMQRSVTGLSQDNFQVFEGKTPQTIQHFSNEDVPVSLGIIVDASGSMNDKMDRVREAVDQLCESSNPQDEFFMVVFSDEPQLAADFTSSPEDLKQQLLTVRPKGRTALLDAIDMGLRKLKDAKYGKRALLVISDGGDNHSRRSEKQIKAAARESDVMIYSIGTFDRSVPTHEELLGPELLSAVAEPTGGRAFVLSDASGMPAVARHIGIELRNQYVLAYRPENSPHDGKWRKIKVKLRLPQKLSFLRAHAKTGYYASAETGAPVTRTSP